ncbi:hypothetical protein AMTR_s00082p00143050 [Amborella trichopoda]|uniref:Uncharacterized protein n=1 Tax=Amborella trichopoda TaxID=13333 RepID=W1NU46_AMBTC|nr:hypothetical protein AMTR_s00082p00143050 [Amborella trichopoda]
MAEVNLIVSAAADEGLIVVQEKNLGWTRLSNVMRQSLMMRARPQLEERNLSPLSDLNRLFLDNRDDDMGNVSQEEGPDERSEQPMTISLDDLDKGVRDEGLSIARGGGGGSVSMGDLSSLRPVLLVR